MAVEGVPERQRPERPGHLHLNLPGDVLGPGEHPADEATNVRVPRRVDQPLKAVADGLPRLPVRVRSRRVLGLQSLLQDRLARVRGILVERLGGLHLSEVLRSTAELPHPRHGPAEIHQLSGEEVQGPRGRLDAEPPLDSRSAEEAKEVEEVV